jgi:hypothetical protein
LIKATETAAQPEKYSKIDAEKQAAGQAPQAYAEYQENITKCSNLRANISKGITGGEDPTTILLKAIECISLMTGDKLYYDSNWAKMEEIKMFLG